MFNQTQSFLLRETTAASPATKDKFEDGKSIGPSYLSFCSRRYCPKCHHAVCFLSHPNVQVCDTGIQCGTPTFSATFKTQNPKSNKGRVGDSSARRGVMLQHQQSELMLPGSSHSPQP